GIRDFHVTGVQTCALPIFIPPVTFFAVAFAIDMLTNQQYSSIWGSAAIVASVIWLFPTILPAVAALGTYAAVWIGFNLVRAFARSEERRGGIAWGATAGRM